MIYEGPSNIISQPVINFSSDQLTSLEATVVNDFIVVLAGTADGKIKKVVIVLTNMTIKRSMKNKIILSRIINKRNIYFNICEK